MQHSVLFSILVSALPASVLALPAEAAAHGARSLDTLAARASNKGGDKNGVSDTQVMNAVMSWMQDTGKVSAFLNSATSYTGDEFTKQATIALNAEIDELNHKKVLDAALGGQDSVNKANDVLANQGTFQKVVDALQSMVTNGPDTAQKDVDDINNNRCVNVLPNIDMYFAAAGASQVLSVRPTGCLEVEGSNVTPAVPPPKGSNGKNGNANGRGSGPAPTAAPNSGRKGNGNGNRGQNSGDDSGNSDSSNNGNNNRQVTNGPQTAKLGSKNNNN